MQVLLAERGVGGARGHEFSLHLRHQRVARLRGQAPRGDQPRAHVGQVLAVRDCAACHTVMMSGLHEKKHTKTLVRCQEAASSPNCSSSPGGVSTISRSCSRQYPLHVLSS